MTRLERQPGQKEARYAQLMGGPVDAATDWVDEDRPERATGAARPDRFAALEERLATVEADLAILQAEHQNSGPSSGSKAARRRERAGAAVVGRPEPGRAVRPRVMARPTGGLP